MRGVRRVASLDGPDPPQSISNSASPFETSVATEKAVLVNQAIARLPDRQRMVLVMRLWNDMSYGGNCGINRCARSHRAIAHA